MVCMVGGMDVVAGLLVGGGMIVAPSALGGATCFGQPVTIADHSGGIYGTDGDDVIIGNGGNNTI
jgi:hypothetical protein